MKATPMSRREGEMSEPRHGRGLTRRRFLGIGAMAAVPAAGLSSGAGWKMRLSTSSIQFMRLPIEKACERIATLGFEAIDIWSAHAGCPHLDDVQNRLGAHGLMELLQKHALKLCAFSVYSGGYPKYAKLLGDVGGGLAIRGSTKPPAHAGEIQSQIRAFIESLKPELELCERFNGCLCIENHGNALLDSLDSFKAFADQNVSPRLGIALAPYHLQRAGISVPEAIAACGRHLKFFYAWQNAEGLGQLPGHGPADFRPWLDALRQQNYGGYVNPFMHHEPEPDAMSQALKRAKESLIQQAA